MGAALGLACPEREPHPVLLEQLTQLAAASVAPPAKPWWHRLTVKTGAATVAGVLMISGATADAEHAKPRMPEPRTVVGAAGPLAPHHVARHAHRAAITPPASAWPAPSLETADVGRHVAGPHRQHRVRPAKNHARKKADLRQKISEASAPLVSAAPLQASLRASSNSPVTPKSHGHARARAKSHR